MLRPYRRDVSLVVRARRAVHGDRSSPGRSSCSYGIDQGITPGNVAALNIAVGRLRRSSPIIAYVVYRAQVITISRAGEGFLRDLRVRVFDHLQRLSMPFYDRRRPACSCRA